MAPVATTSPYTPTTMSGSSTSNHSSLKSAQSATSNVNNHTQIPSPPPLPKLTARPKEVLDAPARTSFEFDPIEDAIAAFARGEFLVVADDEGRENEGDLIIAGSEVSTEKMAWMIRHTRCVSSRVACYGRLMLTRNTVF